MSKAPRIALFISSAALAVLAIAVLIFTVFVDVNAYKPWIESVVSSAIGMDVRIGGRMRISLLPDLHVSLGDVHISRHGTDIVSAQRVNLGIQLLPLLHKDVRFGHVALEQAVFTVERGRDGHLNLESAPSHDASTTGTLPVIDMTKVTFANTTLSYIDQASDARYTLESCDLDVNQLQLPSGTHYELLDKLSFTAQLACKILRQDKLTIADLHLGIEGHGGVYRVDNASAAQLVYSGADGAVTATQLKADARQLVFSKAERNLPGGLNLFGNIAIGTIHTRNLVMSDVQASVVGKAGSFDFDPLSMRIFAGQASGKLHADLAGSVPVYHLRYTLSKFRIEEFTKSIAGAKRAEGAMNLSTDLMLQGKTVNELRRSAAGTVSLSGTDLALHGIDLDRQLTQFESSQSFNLVDAGALFFAGPFGPALTKGYNFASLLHGAGGNSRIRVLISDWRVDHGVARARDVALATRAHRLALKGRLDFVRQRYDDVTVALIDTHGCAMAQQKIHGPFGKPQVEKINVLTSLSAPVVKLFKQTLNWVTGKHCEVFYAGSVQPPS
jgi:hypothetical protein